MTLAQFIPIPLVALARDLALLDASIDRFRFLVLDEAALEKPVGTTAVTAPNPRIDGAGELQTNLIVFPFDGRAGRVTLGRNPKRSEIVIRDQRVSGAHAAIAPCDAHSSWLIDLASSNGTFLGPHCLPPGEAGRVVLQPGARFMLANVGIRFLSGNLMRELARAAAPAG